MIDNAVEISGIGTLVNPIVASDGADRPGTTSGGSVLLPGRYRTLKTNLY